MIQSNQILFILLRCMILLARCSWTKQSISQPINNNG